MLRIKFTIFTISLLFLLLPNRPLSSTQYAGLDAGLYAGRGWNLYWETDGLAEGFPAAVRLGIGRSSLNPGNAADARKIFINNATNGVPDKKGNIWNYRADLLFPLKLMNLPNSSFFLGPRYIRFKGNFRFIGGNEDFDVTSNHWGLGVGLESVFPVSQKFSLRIGTGIDYFLKSTLQGHDTSYSPDGVFVNQRENYTYKDADKAVNQPSLELRLMIGLKYRF